MSHLTDADLQAWTENPASDAVAPLRSHVAACDACRILVARAVREAAPPEPAIFNAADFAAAGYGRQHAASPRPRWKMFAIPAAAAALLALAIAIPVLRQRPAQGLPADSTTRGTSLTAQSPSGQVATVTEFRWSSPVAAASYRIEVRSQAGAIIYTTMTGAERVALNAGESARFAAGDYRWLVAALDDQGNVIVESTPQTFKVR